MTRIAETPRGNSQVETWDSELLLPASVKCQTIIRGDKDKTPMVTIAFEAGDGTIFALALFTVAVALDVREHLSEAINAATAKLQ